MARPLEELQAALKRAKHFSTKQEALFLQERLAQRDIHLAYEITFLSCFVSFERFLEEQLIDYMCGAQPANSPKIKRRVELHSEPIAREVLYGRKNYIEFIPYENTIEIAKIYLRGGRPFTDTDNNDTQNIKLCQKIRNVIAHQSAHSLNEFSKKILLARGIGGHIKTPGQYLRSSFTADATYFDHHISTLLGTALKIG